MPTDFKKEQIRPISIKSNAYTYKINDTGYQGQ
jgi:hypothetical protein